MPPSGEGDDHHRLHVLQLAQPRAASSPFIRGMPMSRNATSGANSCGLLYRLEAIVSDLDLMSLCLDQHCERGRRVVVVVCNEDAQTPA